MMGTKRSGGSRVIFEFASGLARKGHQIDIVSIRYRQDHRWFKFPGGVNIHYVPFSMFMAGIDRIFSKLGFEDYEVNCLNRMAKEIPPSDIVIATYCMTAFAAHRCGTNNKVYHIQHYEPLFFADPVMQRAAEQTYMLPLKKIANCSWLKSKLDRYDDKITVIPPGIDLEVFHSEQIDRQDQDFRIVALGRSLPWKGLSDLFEGLKLVRNEIPKLRLIMYGDEPQINAPVPYEYVAHPNDETLARLYSSADVVVTPSWYESFPLPPLEAMACGLPVVVSDFPSNREWISPGINGCLAPIGDAQAFSSAIIEVLERENNARDMKEANLLTVRQKADWNKNSEILIEIYNLSAVPQIN
jgi:glycosyltransferase involved in cell wall biosynthesis